MQQHESAHLAREPRRGLGRILFILLFLATARGLAAQQVGGDLEKRKEYLAELLEIVGPEKPERGSVTRLDATWKDWLERTGELPPDFGAIPSIPLLPDPLVLDESGKNIPVRTPEQWALKRRWIGEQVKHWITGTFPSPPENIEAVVLREERQGGVTSRLVELRFGPNHEAKLTLELLIPPGEGPFPVFLTQWNHRPWALVAARRGYIACIYAGADARDDTEQYAEIWYPEHDFTRLMRRAWAGHRAVDYLYTLPIVNKDQIGIAGHSRNGKQSLMAAAFDERIDAVISSSSGAGGESPFRFTEERYDHESIEILTTSRPNWLHPRLRFFIGREHKLPIDQNLLMALVAPRGLMLSSSATEGAGNPWGVEQSYRSLRSVYDFLDAEERLAIRFRLGMHGTTARDIEDYVDFFDYVFGRSKAAPPNALYYTYSFDQWRRLSGEEFDPLDYPEKDLDQLLAREDGAPIRSVEQWRERARQIRHTIRWSLGDEPAGGINPGPGRLMPGTDDVYTGDYLARVIGRPSATERMGRMPVGGRSSMGDYLHADLYYPVEERGALRGGKVPVVIFLHEYDYAQGYARRIAPFFEDIVDQGYAVLSFDMIGMGTRLQEGTRFYERYPRWSKMGRMVADVQGALDLLENLDFVDKSRVYTVGYALGGTVGLYAAALDQRIAGVASIAGFTPMRRATEDIEGIRAYSHLHGLQPRLGFFVGQESRTPFDFHEVIAAVAPRPVLVVAPELDRHAPLNDVEDAVEAARTAYNLYGAEDRLQLADPQDYNRFSDKLLREIVDWLASQQPGSGN